MKRCLFFIIEPVIVTKAIENQDCIYKVSELLSRLNISHNTISHFIQAFIHRSIVNERPEFAPEHNERLEFLWDAVLELVITDNLYKQFLHKSEWELTDIRSALVRGKNLARISKDLWFQEYLLLWNGEEMWWWRQNEYLLANALEAFLWAIYVDSWLEESRKFINTYVYPTLQFIIENNLFKDFKSLIQEYSQATYDITPTYEVISETWPDHDKVFVTGVYIWEHKVGDWQGSSKKKSQESAAENGYLQKEQWNITPKN